ncbi:MAG TPA: nucleoside triphosphate pyrophosphohydrolase family protein [Ktedonobacterales bacterium]|nr:nucleoside triphosphate pyrophosphohydrolase family protein [Ktedonobacterales bacterium]
MDLETYHHDVLRTIRPNVPPRDRLLIGALGLSGETGEVVDSLKKMLFQDHPLDKQTICDELGDVLWYVVLLCDTLGLTLEDVMAFNVEKRLKRYPDGFSAERSRNRENEGG